MHWRLLKQVSLPNRPPAVQQELLLHRSGQGFQFFKSLGKEVKIGEFVEEQIGPLGLVAALAQEADAAGDGPQFGVGHAGSDAVPGGVRLTLEMPESLAYRVQYPELEFFGSKGHGFDAFIQG